jgi:hypothetical protein
MHRSQAVPGDLAENATKEVEAKMLDSPERCGKTSEKSWLRIMAEEAKFREMGWGTVRSLGGSQRKEMCKCAQCF